MKVVVTGTGTEVGKTFVTAAAIRELRAAGLSCNARKPAQSNAPNDPSPNDAAVLAGASGEADTTVCPQHRWYHRALAPPMAAHNLGFPAFTVAELIDEIAPTTADFAFIEGAGGLRSPIAHDGDTLTIIEMLNPEVVVLVADAELGTINSVRLAAESLRQRCPHNTPLLIVHLNRFDARNELHQLNQQWLNERDGFTVTVHIDGLTTTLRTLRAHLQTE